MSDHDKATITIVFDIFSGHPNPSWQLSGRQAEELQKLLGESPREAPRIKRKEPPILGYRGFIIVNPNEVGGIPPRLEVYEGVVSIREAEEYVSFEDMNRIEYWLLEQAAEKGYPEATSRVGRKL